ncbi:hypothetical protein TB2_006722 [Malus domestica]
MEEFVIPPHFLCPISLEIMRDPVTISTGITYDRESIEQWWFTSKNNTCPVSKKSLSDVDADLTPNHTLRRIIQAWCTLNSSYGVELIPTPKSALDKSQVVMLIEQAKKIPHTNLHCLQRLRSIAIQGERNKNCLEAAGAIEYVASIINKSQSDSSTVEAAIEVLFHFKNSESRLKDLMSNDSNNNNITESLVRVLDCGNYQSRAHAIMLLKSFFEVADPIQLINVDVESFRQIVHVLNGRISQAASKAALKLLVELCPWGRNRIKAVQSGAVSVLTEALLGTQEKRTCELILIILEQLCGCAEGRAELLKHGAGLAIVSKKILRVSHVASDRAVRILSSICRFSATCGVLQDMLQVGAVAKLCLVLQVDCRFKTKEKARVVLKLHSRVWKNSSCIPDHLLPFYPDQDPLLSLRG